MTIERAPEPVREPTGAERRGPRIGRRQLLTGLGGMTASVGIGATAAAARGRDGATPGPAGAAGAARGGGDGRPIDLEVVQGNILGGFHQGAQSLVFVQIPSPEAGRTWLRSVQADVVSAATVRAAHEAFADDGRDRSPVWVNVALSHAGLAALGRPNRELDRFPRAFRAGMAARARRIGDTGQSAPDRWPAPYRQSLHAVVIVAADDEAGLADEVARQRRAATDAGLSVVHVEEGRARVDEPGHEHFGFRDGISQPGIRGFTEPQNPDDDGQGLPGQDLLWPGEFLIGHPRQAGVGGGDEPGRIARGGPEWTDDGSFLVFRRLTQDVPGFHAFVREVADRHGMTEDLAGAKVVGRYKSGAPLTTTGLQDRDPGPGDPASLTPERINDFEFEGDFDGSQVPLAAHIRKTYPRDQPTDDGGEEDTQTHRLLRRGIPFGTSYTAGAAARPSFPDDRGLLFLAYQWSIEQQFEHVQRRWVNDPDFPEDDAGQDPVIAQSPATGAFALGPDRADHVALMQRFVTTTGGEYFFQPSIPALDLLGRAPDPDAGPRVADGRGRAGDDRANRAGDDPGRRGRP